jgi:hypothetical protein
MWRLRWVCSGSMVVWLLACSNSSVPGDGSTGSEIPSEVARDELDDGEEQMAEFAADPTFSLTLTIDPAEPEEPQIWTVSLFFAEGRLEPVAHHADGTPIEVHHVLSEPERSGLIGALRSLQFFEVATSAASPRSQDPQSEPPGELPYEPPAGGALQMIAVTHDEDWYHYRVQVIEEPPEAMQALIGLQAGLDHVTAASLEGLVDGLRDPDM